MLAAERVTSTSRSNYADTDATNAPQPSVNYCLSAKGEGYSHQIDRSLIRLSGHEGI